MNEKLIIVGIGSIAPEVVDFVNRYNLYDIEGFSVDEKYLNNNEYMGKPVYPLERIEEFVDKDVKFFVAISWYNYMNRYKRQKYDYLKGKGYSFANLISPLASVKSEIIGEGNWLMDFCSLGYGTQIGNNNTFCAFSMVGHYSIIGNHNVLSGRASIAGDTIIGHQNYFGLCSTVFNKLRIGDKNLIGGGTIIKRDLENCVVAAAPESLYKQVSEKSIEFFLSPKCVEIMKQML